MRKHLLIWMLAVTAIATGCASDRKRGGAAPVENLEIRSFAKDWSAQLDLNGSRVVSLYQGDNLVFAYGRDNVAWVLNRDNSDLLFIHSIPIDKGEIGRPVVVPNHIVYPTNATLEVYDRRGFHERTIALDTALRSSAIGEGERVWVGSDYSYGGRLLTIALDREFNEKRWELMTFGAISAAPAFRDEVIYVGSNDGGVYAVMEERLGIWPLERGRFMTGGSIVADVMADDYGVYVASTDSKLYCLAAANGRVRWQYFAGTPLTHAPAITNNMVYQYVRGQGLVALAKTEGSYNRQPKWIAKDMVQFLSSDDKYVYARSRNGFVVALDKQDGKEVFRSQRKFDEFITNTRDSGIFVGTSGGEIMKIRPVLRPGDVGERV